jgi:hypothetical protein
VLSVSSSLLSFWLPWIYSPFPFFMEFSNGVLLQLFECIESTQNEVKRKMIEKERQHDTPKSPTRRAREKMLARHHRVLVILFSDRALCTARTAQRNGWLPFHLDCAPRIFAPLFAIYNQSGFESARFCHERAAGAQSWRVPMRL